MYLQVQFKEMYWLHSYCFELNNNLVYLHPIVHIHTVWGPILGTFKHLSMHCDSLYISRQNVPVHSCYIFSAFCSIKHFRISCRFRCFTADFRSTDAAPILGSCDPIIGPVAGALQSQRDTLAHRAWLTREQSSIENDVGIQVTHSLVLCHLTGEKLNKTTVNSGNLLFWHRIWTISTWVFTRSKYKQILCK